MANDENLIPFHKRTEKEQRAIRSKGGSSKSLKKKLAAQIREAKKKGATSAELGIMLQAMEDSHVSSFEVLKYLQEVKKRIHPAQEVALANTMLSWHKSTHGDKSNTTNIQINIMSEGDTKSAIKRLLNEDNSITVGDDTAEQ